MTITAHNMLTETKDKEAWLEEICKIDLSKKLSGEDREKLKEFLVALSEYFDNINYLLGEGEM